MRAIKKDLAGEAKQGRLEGHRSRRAA
jgi:hypothetical protein